VKDYINRGELEAAPLYFQNLGEAEFVVAVYMYMRLLGYPKESIAILAMTHAQVMLIRDVLHYRCSNVPLFGLPSTVSTVDEYQAFSIDYILLSFVRTNLEHESSHFRDIRRILCAISRARLGFYFFCRESVLAQCSELQPIYSQFVSSKRPTSLELIPNERYQEVARSVDDHIDSIEIGSVEQMGQLVHKMTLEKIAELRVMYKVEPSTTSIDESMDTAEAEEELK
jgi:intron-binding protein aquarius